MKQTQHISLLQKFSLLCCEEIPAGAGDEVPKLFCENLENVHHSESIRRFRRLLLTAPNASTHMEHTAIWPEVG